MIERGTCTKTTILAINIGYVVVGILLIGVATYGKNSTEITPIVGAIIACGIFLLCVAILGIIGTVKSHRGLLFYYMLVLAIIFIIQLAVACACLAVKEREKATSKTAWDLADTSSNKDAIHDVQTIFQCCGYDTSDPRRSNSSDSTWTSEKTWCSVNIIGCAEQETTTQSATTNRTANITSNTAIPTTTNATQQILEFDDGCQTCEQALDDKIEDAFKILSLPFISPEGSNLVSINASTNSSSGTPY